MKKYSIDAEEIGVRFFFLNIISALEKLFLDH
jgi:hypothetical protein